MDKDDITQAFLLQDPDRERLVRIERHVELLLERQRIGRIDTFVLLVNPLLIGGLEFILRTLYEGGRNVAVWFLHIPVFILFIIFAFVFGIAFFAGYLWYLVDYLKDSLTGRIGASGFLLIFALWLVTMEASLALIWQFANILNALGWAAGWYLLAVGGLLCLAARTMFRAQVWLAHWYGRVAPLTVDDERSSLDELVNSSLTNGRKWGFLGRYFWWASCVLYGVHIVLYVFELVFLGFPLAFAISTRLNEGVTYNTVGLFLMVFTTLVIRWRMKHWRLQGKWWATEPPT